MINVGIHTEIIPILFMFIVWNKFIDLMILHHRYTKIEKDDKLKLMIENSLKLIENKDKASLNDIFSTLNWVDRKIIISASIMSLCLFSIFDLGTPVWFIFVAVFTFTSFLSVPDQVLFKEYLTAIEGIKTVSGGDY